MIDKELHSSKEIKSQELQYARFPYLKYWHQREADSLDMQTKRTPKRGFPPRHFLTVAQSKFDIQHVLSWSLKSLFSLLCWASMERVLLINLVLKSLSKKSYALRMDSINPMVKISLSDFEKNIWVNLVFHSLIVLQYQAL